jgi:uncharacterized protein GlcG (DUF336 family)
MSGTAHDLDNVDASRRPTASQASGLTLAAARRMLAAVEAEACSIGVAMSVAVVGSGDQLVAFARMDGADLVGVRLAQDKAYTALVNRMSTADLAAIVQPGTEFYGYDSVAGGRIDRSCRRAAARARRGARRGGGRQRLRATQPVAQDAWRSRRPAVVARRSPPPPPPH